MTQVEKMRDALMGFYRETFAKSLKIRTTKRNVILYLTRPERKVVARFDIAFAGDADLETTTSLAMRMADACKDAVVGHLVDAEMHKMDEATLPPDPKPEPLEQAKAIVEDNAARLSDMVDAAKYAVEPEEKPKQPAKADALSLFLDGV